MGSQPLIVNELLAFVKHAIDYMDELSILQICKSQYKEEEVSSAKLLLFQTLGKVDQMPSRRRDGTAKSVQDIISLLKEVDPDDIPDFVAKDLHKLPPVTFDHVDVTRMLKDITSLNTSLAKLQSRLETSESRLETSEKTVEELRAEVMLLRSAASVSRSPDVEIVDASREAHNASAGSFKSASPTSADASPNASCANEATRTVAVPALKEVAPRVGTSTPKRAYSAIVATSEPAASQIKRRSEIGAKQSHNESARMGLQEHGPEKVTNDEEGFIKVEKKKRMKKPTCPNKCGTAPTGPNHLLRPAVPVTLLYVSRLHYSTKVEEVVEYIRIKSNFALRVERLASSHNVNFNSFVVRVPTEHLSTFTKEEFWPKGVMFRRFRGRLPADTARHTTPTLRVK